MTAPSTAATAVIAEPFFLDTPSGRLFAVHHRPRELSRLRGHVLCVPPFNEEMNRCRSMLALQAQALAELGLGMLVLDLHGTGDSEGEYRDARWPAWLDDVEAAAAWLQRQAGGLVAVLGVRLGAILAAQLAARLRRPEVAQVFWQPVLDGKLHLTQFLRVRMAAQLDRPDLPKETTATMRQQLAAGECLEVAGYELHPALTQAIDAARLLDHPPAAGGALLWLENASPERLELAPASAAAVQAWASAGVAVEARAYAGPAFWQVHERAIAPTLIEQTRQWLGARLASA